MIEKVNFSKIFYKKDWHYLQKNTHGMHQRWRTTYRSRLLIVQWLLPLSHFVSQIHVRIAYLFLISGTITFSHSIGKKIKHRYQSFTRIGRQFQSLERQIYADWTSVSFPFCQRSCLIWRIMTNTLTNTMTNTYVVIFCRFQFLVEVIIPDIRISSSLG